MATYLFSMVRPLCALAAIAGASCLFPSSPADAQGPPGRCMSRDLILKQLQNQYGEEPVATGVSSGGTLVELLTAEDGSTWTMLITLPRGVSCLVASGEGWQPADLKKGDENI